MVYVYGADPLSSVAIPNPRRGGRREGRGEADGGRGALGGGRARPHEAMDHSRGLGFGGRQRSGRGGEEGEGGSGSPSASQTRGEAGGVSSMMRTKIQILHTLLTAECERAAGQRAPPPKGRRRRARRRPTRAAGIRGASWGAAGAGTQRGLNEVGTRRCRALGNFRRPGIRWRGYFVGKMRKSGEKRKSC